MARLHSALDKQVQVVVVLEQAAVVPMKPSARTLVLCVPTH